MALRSYGQYCGLARALDLVGERWALLLVRDLLVAPKRYSDLRRGLPRIPTNVLSTRLRDLEEGGVVRRRARPRPEGGVVYELTPYGRELEDIVLRLGSWGALSLAQPQPGEILTADAMVLALRAMFHPAAASGVHARFQIELTTGGSLHARVDDMSLVSGLGPLPDADLTIRTDAASVGALLAGTARATEAVETNVIRLSGKSSNFVLFTRIFHR